MTGWPAFLAWWVPCWAGELSQQPTCPHNAHRRRWNHQPPALSHSKQPGPLGGTVGSIGSCSLPVLIAMVILLRRRSAPDSRRPPGVRQDDPRQLDAGSDAELAVDVADVGVDRVRRHRECLGDGTVRLALGGL